MKRAFRSFGVQFGNGFYGDPSTSSGEARQPANAPQQPQRVPAQTNGRSGQNQANRRVESQAETLRKRLIEIAIEQGFDEAQVRAAVQRQTGKGLDDLTADEIGTLVEAAANKLNQMRQAQAA